MPRFAWLDFPIDKLLWNCLFHENIQILREGAPANQCASGEKGNFALSRGKSELESDEWICWLFYCNWVKTDKDPAKCGENQPRTL